MAINRVLIGGGTGFIGSSIINALHKQAIQTCVVSRMPAPDSITWEELNSKGIPNGIDAIINLSGQNVLDPKRRWTPGFQQNVVASRVETNRMLLNAIRKCKENPPKVFITISGVGFYPSSTDNEYSEDSAGGDHDFLSKLCLEWENACKGNPNVRNVIVRSGIVLGPNGGIVKEMYRLFWLGLGAKIGSGKQFMPWIHQEDLADIFVEAIHNENFDGVINGVAPQVITNGQFTKALGRALWRPSFLTVPEKVIELIFGPDRSVMMTKGQKVISKRLTKLGYKFKYDNIDSALKQIVG